MRQWVESVATLLLVLTLAQVAQSQQGKVLCGFEGPQLPRIWEYQRGTPRLVKQDATEGKQALEIVFDSKSPSWGAYINTFRLPHDWSAFDALILDVFNPNEGPVAASVLVADKAWHDKGATYWNRHNGGRSFPPGKSQWILPVRGFYRGEAGSRNNDIKRNIDADAIVRLDFGFGRRGTSGRIIIDNLRLVKTATPNGVWAFDFGPPSQSLMLGWAPVSQKTSYTTERGYGWGPRGGAPWDGAARDTTFGTMLLQDFCEARGNNFHVDVPSGRYHVVVYYENSGYWGGEQAQQRERTIFANGKQVWKETRKDGSEHALYRFEDVEPIGVDIWDTYMESEIAKSAKFDVPVDRDGLTLRFDADRAWGCKIAGVTVVRIGDRDGEKWLQEQTDKLKKEFRGKAVCLDPLAPELDVPEAWRSLGLVVWPVRIEQDISPNSTPASLPEKIDSIRLKGTVVQAEFEPLCVAIRPLRNLGKCQLELEPMEGPGDISAELHVVRYNTSRSFGRIAYHVRAHTLRPATVVAMPKDVTREFIVTVLAHRNTDAGTYHGGLVVNDADGKRLYRVPLSVSVHNILLDRKTDFLMGFFGLMPPNLIPKPRQWEVLDRTLLILRQHGMNAVSGGPSWKLTGWQNGKPTIDFGEMDRFFTLLRKRGFNGAVNGYGGIRFRGLNQRYEKGNVGETVERESGLPYQEALMRSWRAVDGHARAAQWPTIFYAMCDETRVRDQAERELAFMQMMKKVSAAFPVTIRTSGSYSVHFNVRPTDKDNMLYWHQRFFENLDINSLNNHDSSVMAEAKKNGSQIHIYNQGRTRYSFGLYQWSEYRKDVRARWQWHLNVLHGYQYFDLDGREPDTAVLCYGRNGLYPTIDFERCREGAEDFYLYNTLWKRVQVRQQNGDNSPIVQQARALIDGMTTRIQLNQRQPPDGYDPYALKEKIIEAIEQLD